MSDQGTARIVSIRGADAETILLVRDVGMPIIVAMAEPPLPRVPDAATLAAMLNRATRINGMDASAPSAVLIPTGGQGAFQWPALAGHRDGRDFLVEFGDWRVEQPRSDRATLIGHDRIARLAIGIEIAVSGAGVTTLATRLTNEGSEPYTLDRLMAASVPADDVAEILAFDGMWGREFHARAEPPGIGIWSRESRRGRTSHDRYPAMILGGAGMLEGGGPCLGVHLGWSGNHHMVVDRLDDGRRLAHAGELFEPGEMRLAPGETYRSPLAHIRRDADLNALSSAFHAHVRETVLAWPGGSPRPRPVILNSWEANYFVHEPAALMAQASAAAALGVERFVLDDGWFKGRDDDRTSLGDWVVDARKYPQGLGPLIAHVSGLGMEFGLWVEPEMVNPDSDLFRAHPEWALGVAGRPITTSRHQLVLDLTRPEVADHLFERLDAILSAHDIAYLKWDMNRDLTAAGGAEGRAVTSGQTRAVYALMARVRAAHPKVEIESCASGGGRADYGALAHTHRVWTSDCTDALERQEIQRGASIFLPPEVLGAHVSASPNHQTGRRHSLAFRAITALSGHLGVELDPLTLSETEREELAGFIALHKRLRPLLHGRGRVFRHPLRNGRHAYGVIDEGRTRGALILAQVAYGMAELPPPVTVPGLDPAKTYRLTIPAPQRPKFIRIGEGQRALLAGEVPASGAVLGSIGFAPPEMRPETAVLIEIEEANPHG